MEKWKEVDCGESQLESGGTTKLTTLRDVLSEHITKTVGQDNMKFVVGGCLEENILEWAANGWQRVNPLDFPEGTWTEAALQKLGCVHDVQLGAIRFGSLGGELILMTMPDYIYSRREDVKRKISEKNFNHYVGRKGKSERQSRTDPRSMIQTEITEEVAHVPTGRN